MRRERPAEAYSVAGAAAKQPKLPPKLTPLRPPKRHTEAGAAATERIKQGELLRW